MFGRWLRTPTRRLSPKPGRRPASGIRPTLENLDERLMPSVTAQVSNGYLFLSGSNGNDNIIVRQQNGRITVDGLNGSLAVSSIRGIRVDSYAGNDYVYMGYVTLPTWVFVGNGNDSVVGGRGNNTIQAGSGSDYIYSGYGGYNTVVVGRAGDTIINASCVRMAIDTTYTQGNTNWCGPVAVDRLMRSYGYNVTPQQVHDAAIDSIDSWIIDQLGLGHKPGSLFSAMQRLGMGNAGYENQTDLNRVIQLLASGKPVVALIATGGQLHYITLNGFDSASRQIFYYDPNDRYQHATSYQNFYNAWEWSFGLADAALRLAGVRSRTILY